MRLASLLLVCAGAAYGAEPAMVTVDLDHPGARLPADFLGISYEKNALVEAHFTPANTTFLRLHRNLGAGTLRLGGNKVELTRWLADAPAALDKATGRATIGRATLDDLYGFLAAADWRCLHGLNLADGRPTDAAEEASYALRVGGRSVSAFEVGNEPNLYPNHGLRPAGYDTRSYVPEARMAIKLIRARNPGLVLAGPATARREDRWFEDAVAGLRGELALGTSHLYALSGGSTNPRSANFPSPENLLSPATMAKDLAMVDTHLAAARAAGMRYRLAECNSVSNGGRAGVSDTFVSSLWAVDFLFGVAEHGADGINFHCNLKPGSYSPFSRGPSPGTYTVHPIYYAMLLFRDAGRGRLLNVKVTSGSNLGAHATLGDDGDVRVALVNKDLTREVVATIHARGRRDITGLSWLLAPQADAKEGVSYAGAKVGPDGSWQPSSPAPDIPKFRDGQAVLTLPPGCAAVLTLK